MPHPTLAELGKGRRRFDGKLFVGKGNTTSKRLAKKTASSFRKRGFLARVIKRKVNGRTVHTVFIRGRS